jgi:hypothetical protein
MRDMICRDGERRNKWTDGRTPPEEMIRADRWVSTVYRGSLENDGMRRVVIEAGDGLMD